MDPFIMLLLCFSTGVAQAATTTASQNASFASFLPMILVFFAAAYFLMIRPQNKRIRAHRKLISELSKGDEVVTAGGMIGKVVKISDDFITVSVADNVELNFQKSAITTVLPKGTVKTIAQ